MKHRFFFNTARYLNVVKIRIVIQALLYNPERIVKISRAFRIVGIGLMLLQPSW